METVDVLIVVFAVVAVVGSVAGAALYEPGATDQEFSVTFARSSQRTLEPMTEDDTVTALNSPDSATFSFTHNISATSIVALSFEIDVAAQRQAQLPRAATPTFTVTLTAPDGTEFNEGDGACSATMQGSGGSCSVSAPARYLTTVPEESVVVAAGNQDQADEYVNTTYLSHDNATGEWTVTVTVNYPQGSAPQQETVRATSTPMLRVLEASVTPRTPDLPGAA